MDYPRDFPVYQTTFCHGCFFNSPAIFIVSFAAVPIWRLTHCCSAISATNPNIERDSTFGRLSPPISLLLSLSSTFVAASFRAPLVKTFTLINTWRAKAAPLQHSGLDAAGEPPVPKSRVKSDADKNIVDGPYRCAQRALDRVTTSPASDMWRSRFVPVIGHA